jgi:hypothetical protein
MRIVVYIGIVFWCWAPRIAFAQYSNSFAINVTNSEVIGSVKFGGGMLGNNSSWTASTDIINPANFGSTALPCRGYSDYTIGNNNPNDGNLTNLEFSATVQAGGQYTLVVKGTSCGTPSPYMKAMRAYVDWNQDNDFNDVGELMFTSPISTLAIPTFFTSITVPSTFVGNTRMRIVFCRLGTLPVNQYFITSNTSYFIGETHDYTLIGPISYTVNAGVDQIVCDGDSVQLEATEAGNSSYLWTPSAGLSNPNIANPVASPVATTTYTVQADSSGYTATDSVTVYVYPYPVFTVSGDQTICYGGNPSDISASFIPGASYSWTPTSYLNTPNDYQSSFSTTVTSTTTFTVAVDLVGCVSEDSLTITPNAQPIVDLLAGPNPICDSGLVVLQASPSFPVSHYQFQQFDGSVWNDLTTPAMNTVNPLIVPSVNTPTDFRVRVAEYWPGCTPSAYDTASVNITTITTTPIIHY